MGFGNLKFPFSLKVLINYLADRSNVIGYVSSQADVVEKEKCGLSGVKKPVRKYIPAETEDTTAPKNEEEEEDDDDDDDAIDLFESNTEEECEEAKKIKEEHLTQLEAKISRKPTLLTKSSIFFEMKPWDVEMDDKFGPDQLEELITGFEDYIQSIDMAALNKMFLWHVLST
uniref:Uncharacterized protein n=1 Tax=Erpetoichthys calabaricus TaxID=27687 RepID=A0A8C4TBH8_ERPCA